MSTPARSLLSDWWHRASLQPDVSRALRATVAFMVPLLLAFHGWLPIDVSFTALTAQNLAMVDIRGDYRVRLGFLIAMTVVFVGVATLGTAVAQHLPLAIVATCLVAVGSSAWRHLSPDYGAGLAIASTFVFAFALASPIGRPLVGAHALATLIGGLWGTLVQVAAWPWRPQHPLRRAVSDSWLAVAELFDVLATPSGTEGSARHERVTEKEAALRTTLDATTAALEAARPNALRTRLGALNFAAARLATRVAALNTALESLAASSDYAALAPTLEPVLVNLSNLSRTIAIAVVSRQPGHVATFEVRLRRAAALLPVTRSRIALHAAQASAAAQVAEILGQVESHLPDIQDALRATVARADERAAFSLQLLDLRTLALRPLASALNLSWQVDAALVRFTYRTAILTSLGVLAFKLLHLPHGYWLPFTVVVVLQPDYGSTRRRAAQRMLGTFAGAVLASGLLWLRLPFPVVMLACAVTIMIFGYWLKRNYGIAVIFITLFVVLLTDATGPLTWELTAERLGSTLAGGLIALLAAQLFWPVWERDRLPPILSTALQSNRGYFRTLAVRAVEGGVFDAAALRAKRETERANAAAFSSLTRLSGDPRNQREGLEYAATLANGNQRITRALNVLSLHLSANAPWRDPALPRFIALAEQAFAHLATGVLHPDTAPAETERLLRALEADALPLPPVGAPLAHWVFRQFTQIATELCAMLVTLQDAAPARAG